MRLDIQKNFKGFSLNVKLKGQVWNHGNPWCFRKRKEYDTYAALPELKHRIQVRSLLTGRTVFDSEKKINLQVRRRARVGYLFPEVMLFFPL